MSISRPKIQLVLAFLVGCTLGACSGGPDETSVNKRVAKNTPPDLKPVAFSANEDHQMTGRIQATHVGEVGDSAAAGKLQFHYNVFKQWLLWCLEARVRLSSVPDIGAHATSHKKRRLYSKNLAQQVDFDKSTLKSKMVIKWLAFPVQPLPIPPQTVDIFTTNPDLEEPELDINTIELTATPTNPISPIVGQCDSYIPCQR